MGKRTPVNPNLRELTKKSERIKSRLSRRASSIDADTKLFFTAIRNLGRAPLASAGWIVATALTLVPARSSLPLWLKIAASTAREVLANPKPTNTPARASKSRASTSRTSSLEP